MLTIDSQIWIYYLDEKSDEHLNVLRYLDKVLGSDTIVLSAIIPIEVAHHLFNIPEKKKTLSVDRVEELLDSIMNLENCYLIDVDSKLVSDAIKSLKKYRSLGIGGRDSLILASMDKMKITTIATHDKNILGLNHLNRIDPVFDLPMEIKIGEKFNLEEFKIKVETNRKK